MKWSKYQLAIFDAYENTNKNIVIDATAGSGKSRTLKELCNRTPENKSCLFMAFNKSIAEELRSKLPYYVDCYTFHALGLRTMMKNFRFKAKVNDGKCFKLCTKLFQYKKMEFKERMKYFFALQTLWEQTRLSLCKINEENIVPITIEFDLDYEEEMIPDLLEIEKAWRNDCTRINNNLAFEIDFVDMLWIPYTFLEPESFPKYNVVMVDEANDTFLLQKEIMQNLIKARGRFIAVGDKKQCQPKGTKVLLKDLSTKNIEDIEIGDEVVTYEGKTKCTFRGYKEKSIARKVVNKAVRVVDKTVRITTETGKVSEYSYEHLCYAKFNQEFCSRSIWVVYVMENRKGIFRVGKTRAFLSNGGTTFALKPRMVAERCVKAWILKFCESDKEARMEEIFASVKFGIPQIIFSQERSGAKLLKDKDVEILFERWGGLRQRLLNCLSYYNKEYECPFTIISNEEKRGKIALSIYAACNLFPKYMDVCVFDQESKNSKDKVKRKIEQITKVEFLSEQKKVYSLEVEKDHNYVADGILTHNCIYNFIGSDLNVFNSLKNSPNMITLPLSVTYRCSKRIVEEANKVFPGTECAEGAKEGVVRKGELSEAANGDFVLCRNNLPLVVAFLQLLREGKKSSIMGRDFGENICRLMENQTSLDDMYLLLDDKKQKLIEKGIAPASVKNHPSYVSLEEKVKIVELLYESYQGNFSSLKERVKNIFSGDKKGVILSTIHKSKGLEADRVFFLNPELLPSKYAKTPKALYAEECLKFVAITRAKEELVYCHINADIGLHK